VPGTELSFSAIKLPACCNLGWPHIFFQTLCELCLPTIFVSLTGS
jgi:hypothetical protein